MTHPTGPPPTPMPDADGVYMLGPGIAAPRVAQAEPAAYPEGALETDLPHIAVFAVVVGADGLASSIKNIRTNESVYDAGAIAAIRQSKFEPGMLGDKPVPVLVHVRVPFFHLRPAIPTVMRNYAVSLEGTAQRPDRLPAQDLTGVTQPRLIRSQEAEYSDKARRAKIQGSVLISLLVTAEGLPADIQVEKPLGYGLDEKAMQAVSAYRFQPAMRDGKPVPVRIKVEVSFRIYQ